MLLPLLCILLLGGEGVKGRQGIGGIERSEDSLNFEEADISSADVVGARGPGLIPLPATSLWLARTWALALLTFCTLGILLCLLILYYVVVKMREGTLVGNQTMGLLLLLSVLMLFLSVPPWLVPPSHTVCALRHSAHLLALALCLGVLLVKVVAKHTHLFPLESGDAAAPDGQGGVRRKHLPGQPVRLPGLHGPRPGHPPHPHPPGHHVVHLPGSDHR